MIKPSLKGADSLLRKLETLSHNAERMSGTHNVPINDLLTERFMRTHSRFSSIDELFEAGGFHVENEEDLKSIPDADLDSFIQQETNFGTWTEMLEAAAVPWVKKQLGF